jgi:hypothetical protein
MNYPKTDKSYIVVDKENYSRQLRVETHKEHGEVYRYVLNNEGTRFPEYLKSHATFLAKYNDGVLMELKNEN